MSDQKIYKSLEQTKPALFLHFLNPETFRGLNQNSSDDQAVYAIKVLLLAAHEPLYCNLSYVWENYRPTGRLSRFLLEAIRHGLIETLGSYIAPDQFLANIQDKFSYDSHRYDAIFRNVPDELVNLGPKLDKKRSSTSFILASFSNMRHQIDAPPWSNFNTFDKKLLSDNREEIKPILDEMTATNAITLSLFHEKTNGRELEKALARYSTYCHIYNYMETFEASIPVGPNKLGFFDSLSDQKTLTNIRELNNVLCRLGGAVFLDGLSDVGFLQQVAPIRGGSSQVTFVSNLRYLLLITRCVLPNVPNRRFVGDLAELRQLDPVRFLKSPSDIYRPSSLSDLVQTASSELASANIRMKNANPEHGPLYYMLEQQLEITPRILIVVAKEVEARALVEAFGADRNGSLQRIHSPDHTIHPLGTIGGADVYLVQCEAGSDGPSGAILTTIDVIDFLDPDAVICAGISFGMQKAKQKLGEILVSQQVHGYDLKKESERNGLTETISRGPKVPASVRMLDRFKSGKLDWVGAEVHFGLIMSGGTLSNSSVFVESLLDLEPEADGGEMEGYGIYNAAEKRKKDWIVVKAICDWGMGKTDEFQKTAAENAATYIFHVISQGGFAAPRPFYS